VYVVEFKLVLASLQSTVCIAKMGSHCFNFMLNGRYLKKCIRSKYASKLQLARSYGHRWNRAIRARKKVGANYDDDDDDEEDVTK